MDDPKKSITIRPARKTDAPIIVRLVGMLASDLEERSPVNADYVFRFLATPGTGILVADLADEVIGLISYSLRPSLYHAGESCMVDELVVRDDFRHTGVGGMLLKAIVTLATEKGCPEVSLSVMPFNTKAIEFYRRHGFEDEAILLEMHLHSDDQKIQSG
jgi:ribosomal protein S18 acetylase RimI-like enzyme